MTVRIQFDLADEKWDDLTKLMDRLRLDTRKDLFNNALAILEWAVDQVDEQRLVCSIPKDEHSYRELVMPWMKNIKKLEETK